MRLASRAFLTESRLLGIREQEDVVDGVVRLFSRAGGLQQGGGGELFSTRTKRQIYEQGKLT